MLLYKVIKKSYKVLCVYHYSGTQIERKSHIKYRKNIIMTLFVT